METNVSAKAHQPIYSCTLVYTYTEGRSVNYVTTEVIFLYFMSHDLESRKIHGLAFIYWYKNLITVIKTRRWLQSKKIVLSNWDFFCKVGLL